MPVFPRRSAVAVHPSSTRRSAVARNRAKTPPSASGSRRPEAARKWPALGGVHAESTCTTRDAAVEKERSRRGVSITGAAGRIAGTRRDPPTDRQRHRAETRLSCPSCPVFTRGAECVPSGPCQDTTRAGDLPEQGASRARVGRSHDLAWEKGGRPERESNADDVAIMLGGGGEGGADRRIACGVVSKRAHPIRRASCCFVRRDRTRCRRSAVRNGIAVKSWEYQPDNDLGLVPKPG